MSGDRGPRLASGERLPFTEVIAPMWRALAPFHDDLVIVGGFAIYGYHFHHAWTGSERLMPLSTTDIDVVVRAPMRSSAPGTIADHLHAAGADRRDERLESGVVTRYRFHGPSSEPVEFILEDHARLAALPLQLGLQAHAGHDTWMLTTRPLIVEVPDLGPVTLASPVGFVLQKALLTSMRTLAKRAKDLADVVTVAQGFRSVPDLLLHHLAALRNVDTSASSRVDDAISVLRFLFGPRGSGGHNVALAHGRPGDVGLRNQAQALGHQLALLLERGHP